MVGGYHGKAGVATSRLESEELGIINASSKYDREALAVENEGYIPPFLADNDDECDMGECDDTFEGMIFMSNRQTKKECFKRKLFGLPMSQASVVEQIKPGMILFLFEYERRELYGIFEATSCGALNIERNAYKSSRGAFPAQVRFRTVWECHPLSEEFFRNAILENYYTSNKFHFHLSQEQVSRLIYLFSLRKIDGQLVEGTNKHQHRDQKVDKLENSSRLGRDFERVEDDRLDDGHIVPKRIGLKHPISCLTRSCCAGELPGAGLSLICNAHLRSPRHEMNPTNYQAPKSLLHMEPKFSNIQEGTLLSEGRNDFYGHPICDISNTNKSLAPHSVQVPTVCGGDCQLHANSDYQDFCTRGYGVCEDNLRDTLLSRDYMNDLARENLLSRDNQICQTQKFKIVEGAMDFSGHAALNVSNRREEMHGTSIGSVHIASNQHHDSLYINENAGAYGSQSFSSVSRTSPMPASKILSDVCEQLNRLPAHNSQFLCCAGGCSSHTVNLEDAFPLCMGVQPEYPIMQPKLDDYYPTGMASSSKSDICMKKKSVFARLSMPESRIDLIDTLLRRKRPRRSVEPANEETKKLGLDENVKEIDEVNKNSDNDRIVINFKRRSQVCKAGKERKPENMSMDCPQPNAQTVGRVHPMDEMRKQRRRKLIRPQFGTPKVHSENAIPVHIGKCPSESISESRGNAVSILSVSENESTTKQLASSAAFIQEMVDLAMACDIESKDPPVSYTRQELDKVTSTTVEGNPPDIIFQEFPVGNRMDDAENKDLPALDSRQASAGSCEKVQSSQVVSQSTNIRYNVDIANQQIADPRQASAGSCEKVQSSQVVSQSTNIRHNVDIANQQIADLYAVHGSENKDLFALKTRQELQIVAGVQPVCTARKSLKAEGSSTGIIVEEFAVVNAMAGGESKDLPTLDSRKASAGSCEKVQPNEDVIQDTNIKNNVDINEQQIADLYAVHDFENRDLSALNSRQELQKVASVQPVSLANKSPTECRDSPGTIFEDLAVGSTVDGPENKDPPVMVSKEVSAHGCQKECSIQMVSSSTMTNNNINKNNQGDSDTSIHMK